MSADNSSFTTTDRLWDYSRRIARATSVEQLAKLREEIRLSPVGECDWDYLSRKLDFFKRNLQVYTSHETKMRAMPACVRSVQEQLRQITKDLQQAAEELNSIVDRAEEAARYDEMYTALDQIRARKRAQWERMYTALAEMRARKGEQARAEQATELARRRKLVGLLLGIVKVLVPGAFWA